MDLYVPGSFYIRIEPINPFNMNMKVVMTVVLAGATSLAIAQKPTEGTPHSLEVGLNLTGDLNTLVAPQLKYRYFLSSNMAIRFGLGVDGSKAENNFAENMDGSGQLGTQEIKSSSYSIMPGFEYHFAGTDRLSPYAGIVLSIGGGKSTETWTNYDGDGYANGVSAEIEEPFGTFGVGILFGADLYVAENFFLGAEFGYLIGSMTEKEGTASFTSGGNTSTTKWPEHKSSSNGFGSTAAIRVGWRL